MADQVNKDKQNKLDKFLTQTPRPSDKKDINKREANFSPDNTSPSLQQAEKQARLTMLNDPHKVCVSNADSPVSSPHKDTTCDLVNTASAVTATTQKDETIFQLSNIVCATLKNQEFIDSIIPLISEKVMNLITPQLFQLVDQHMESHIETIEANRKEIELKKYELQQHKTEIDSLKTKLQEVESRLEEQEQYSRRTSLRFNNVKVPVDANGYIVKPVDTDSIIQEICDKQLGVKLDIREISRSHPIGKPVGDKISIIVRFISYRQRHMIINQKKNLKDNPDKTFITENLTRHRYNLMKRLNGLRKNNTIHSFWTYDGSIVVKRSESSKSETVRKLQDIYDLGGDVLTEDTR
ncbi:hypothetical protein SNE40_002348 [Patella caerulea]|uniref:Uncharacterized protein n=1 Tax=Patella caerulea TaxID=87958 RepID=A0AAN8K5N1_PATCE